MGLLNKEKEIVETEIINQKPQTNILLEKPKDKIRLTKEKKDEPKGLLQKAPLLIKQYFDKKNSEVIEVKKGFGYYGLATRRILQDKSSKVFFYEVTEPILTEVEKDIKTELAHLFKMLANINIGNMTEEEKNKFLKETLDQIIIDNDIDFSRKTFITKDEDNTKQKKLSFFKNINEKKVKLKTKDKKTNKKTKH